MKEEENLVIEPYQIDVKQAIKDKNPKLIRLLPGFIVKYIQKIVHEADMNWFLEKHGTKVGKDFADAIIEEFDVQFKVVGADNIPKDTRVAFACNHPLGGFDGVMLISLFKRFYSKYMFIVNDLLLNVKNLSPLLIPINKYGALARKSAALIDEYYETDIPLFNFPAGMVSRKHKGIIRDAEWKKNFLIKSIKNKRDIIPIHISGENSKRFYRIHNFRKTFGIKANLEMFYLVDEFYKHQHKTFTITIGKPIPYKSFENIKDLNEMTQRLRDHVYKLPENENISFNI